MNQSPVLHLRTPHSNRYLNRSVDLSGDFLKGPVQSFGYAPLSAVRPLIGQSLVRPSDYSRRRKAGTDLLSQSLQVGSKAYKNIRCPANIMRAGPPASGANGDFGNTSSYIGSSFYHGKVHQSLNFKRDTMELVGRDTQYSSMDSHYDVIDTLNQIQHFLEKSQLAHSPMDLDGGNTVNDKFYCNFLASKGNHELKQMKKQKINRQIDRKLNLLTEQYEQQQTKDLGIDEAAEFQIDEDSIESMKVQDLQIKLRTSSLQPPMTPVKNNGKSPFQSKVSFMLDWESQRTTARKGEDSMFQSTKCSMYSSRGPFFKDQTAFKTRIKFMNIQHNTTIQSKFSQFNPVPEPILYTDIEQQKYVDSKIDQMFFKPVRPRGYKSMEKKRVFKDQVRIKARNIQSQIDIEALSPDRGERVISNCTAQTISENSATLQRVRRSKEATIKSLIQRAIKSKFMLANAQKPIQMEDLQKQIDGHVTPTQTESEEETPTETAESDINVFENKDPNRHIKQIHVPGLQKLRDQDYNFFEKYIKVVEKNQVELQTDKKPKNLFEDMLVQPNSLQFKTIYQNKARLNKAINSDQFKEFAQSHQKHIKYELKTIESSMQNREDFKHCKELLRKTFHLCTTSN